MYLHLYESASTFQEEYNENYHEPWVSYTNQTEKVNYNKTREEKRIGTPLTFEITVNGNICWGTDAANRALVIEYRKNGGEWTEITATTGTGTAISVVSGDTVQFRGDNGYYSNGDSICGFYGSTARFRLKGNIMSLVDSEHFMYENVYGELHDNAYVFRGIFSECTGLTDASELVLPAAAVSESCYDRMFAGCTGLTTPPSRLPATTLATSCYGSMFSGCTSLTMAPELPATTLATSCYGSMFLGCTSLTMAPDLLAAVTPAYAYYYMFYGCTSLNYVKCLAETGFWTNYWLSGVAANGTFVKKAGVTWPTTGSNGIPDGWTVLEE